MPFPIFVPGCARFLRRVRYLFPANVALDYVHIVRLFAYVPAYLCGCCALGERTPGMTLVVPRSRALYVSSVALPLALGYLMVP